MTKDVSKVVDSSKVALITGASSGFGVEFAKLFASDGYNLVLTAKPKSNLDSVSKMLRSKYGVKVWHKEFDLSDASSPDKIYQWLKKENVTVDSLVNNAGLGLYGKFTDHSIEEENELLNVNINSLSKLCYLFIPGMIKKGGGKILNVASIAGFQPGPFYATYFASKSYVLLFSEALYYEYKDDNISVTALCPGVARTGFFKRANMRENSKLLQTYMMEPDNVALAGYKALMSNKRVIVPGVRNKLVGVGNRILPRSVINKITRDLIKSAAE